MAGWNPISAAQLGAPSIKEAKRIVRGTGKATPLRLRTVEIVTGTATTATRAAARHPARTSHSLPFSPGSVLSPPSRPHCHLKYWWARPLQCSTAPGCDLVRLGGGGGGTRLGLCFLGGIGAVGIQELAGHGRRVRGWIEAWRKRRVVASSSSVLGSGLAGRGRGSKHGGGLELRQVWMPFSSGFKFGSCFQGSFRMPLMGAPAPAVPLASLPVVAAQPLLLPDSCRGEQQLRDRCCGARIIYAMSILLIFSTRVFAMFPVRNSVITGVMSYSYFFVVD